MIPNLIGVLVLSPEIYRITKNYIARHIHGKEEKPILSNFEDVQKDMEKIL